MVKSSASRRHIGREAYERNAFRGPGCRTHIVPNFLDPYFAGMCGRGPASGMAAGPGAPRREVHTHTLGPALLPTLSIGV